MILQRRLSVCLPVSVLRLNDTFYSKSVWTFSLWGLEMRILVRSPVHLTLSVLLLHCNTSRSRPPVRLPSLTFQADCSSIKGAGLSAEEGTEHYLPWWSGEYIRDKFNHCQHRNTKSRRQQLSQLLFRWSWVWERAWPLVPPSHSSGSATAGVKVKR